jgi:hypothetical protein
MRSKTLERLGLDGGWLQEAVLAGITLAIGFGLLPLLIFLVGSSLLGRYEGGSAGRIYYSVYHGLGANSLASWIVVLGPYGLYLIFRGLKFWWRTSARLA